MLEQALMWLGFGLCHQLPERSLTGGGIQLPVCARDTGIYVGFVIASIMIAVLHRGTRPRDFPGLAGMVVVALGIAFMALDGFTSYAGLRPTTNAIRLTSGMAAGFSIAAIVYPMLIGELFARSDAIRVLSPAGRLFVWVAAWPVASLLVWTAGPRFGVWYPVLVTLCIVATFTAVNMVIASLLPPFSRRAESLRDLLGPALVGLGLTVVEIAFSALLRAQLLALLARL